MVGKIIHMSCNIDLCSAAFSKIDHNISYFWRVVSWNNKSKFKLLPMISETTIFNQHRTQYISFSNGKNEERVYVYQQTEEELAVNERNFKTTVQQMDMRQGFR